MNLTALFDNITSPALLFFMLGVFASQIKSDLKIPNNSSKFISVYLLLSIGFKGGQELAHSVIDQEIIWSITLGFLLAALVPVYAFYILRKKLSIENAGAIAAAYGSVSTVTFVTAISFLDLEKIEFGGHMIAVMAIMEAPAIVIGVLLINLYKAPADKSTASSMNSTLLHSVTNGSVVLIIGSLIIGYLASEKQAQGIAPFTTDLFKGFLAVFLLDMGITSGKQLSTLTKHGVFPVLFAVCMPFVNGLIALVLGMLITDSVGNQLLFAALGASASYIAVPAAMKNAAPNANPSLYLPMALGITFPINVILGIPFYLFVIEGMS